MNRDAELAWAAGLFEGEGTITPKLGKGNQHRYQVAIIMTDKDVLARFAEVVGLGRFYGPYQPKNPKAKPIWRWTNTKNAEISQLFELIGPWLGLRRTAAFEAVIADVHAHPAQQWFAKLDHQSHALIRQRYAEGGISQERLGKEYGVTQSMVSVIVRRPALAR